MFAKENSYWWQPCETDLDILIREEVLLGKVACLHLVGAHKGAVLGGAGEVADTLHAAVVLAQGFVVLDTDPDPALELGQTYRGSKNS